MEQLANLSTDIPIVDRPAWGDEADELAEENAGGATGAVPDWMTTTDPAPPVVPQGSGW